MSEPTRIGDTLVAYMGTYMADLERAQAHRTNLQISPAEVALAEELRQLGISGWKQQVNVGRYWIDFLFYDGLAVEIDGATYHSDAAKERRRDAALVRAGVLRVVHFPAAEVFADPRDVVRKIEYMRGTLLGPTMASLPVSEAIQPKPVHRRMVMRMMGKRLGPPTDAEKRHAIEVLREGPPSQGLADPIYVEAERIHSEASL